MRLRFSPPLVVAALAWLLESCVELKKPVPVSETSDAATTSPMSVKNGSPAGETLYGVWGDGGDFVIAVGSSLVCLVSDKGVIQRIGGNESGRDYQHVFGFAKDDVYAVGKTASGKGFVSHFDGKQWAVDFDAPVPLFGLFGFVANGTKALLATGAKGLVYGWSPKIPWKQVLEIPKGPLDIGESSPILWSISGSSGTDFSIAADSRVYHKNDAGIFFYDLPASEGLRFRAAWQSPIVKETMYFGTNFSGMTWLSPKSGDLVEMSLLVRDQSAPAAEQTFVQAVWGTSEKVIGVGDRGLIYAYDTGTAETKRIPSPTDASLTDVWGTSLDDVWMVGERELLLHGSLR